jgi:hypothetical protein
LFTSSLYKKGGKGDLKLEKSPFAKGGFSESGSCGHVKPKTGVGEKINNKM